MWSVGTPTTGGTVIKKYCLKKKILVDVVGGDTDHGGQNDLK
jgi:hypothetical protein